MTSFGLDTRKTQTGESFKIHGDRRNKVPVFLLPPSVGGSSECAKRESVVSAGRSQQAYMLFTKGGHLHQNQKHQQGCTASMHVCQHYNSGTNKINSFNFLIILVSFPCMHILREPLEYLCSKQERINITTKEPTT